MRFPWVVARVGVLGDVEIFLDPARRVGEESRVRADPGSKLIRLGDVVRADRDQPAIAYFKLTVKLKKSFMLPVVLGTIAPAAENENHGMVFLQFGELPPFRGVVGQLVVRKDRSGNDVRSHGKPSLE